MSDLVRPDQGKFRIVPPKDNEVNEYLLKLNAYYQYTAKLGGSGDYPFLDIKINHEIKETVGGYLIDNDLLCVADTLSIGGRLFFGLTSRGTGPSRRWTLEKGRLYTPDDTEVAEKYYRTPDDQRALLRQILSQR